MEPETSDRSTRGRGVTLIEMLLALAILGVVFAALAQLMGAGRRLEQGTGAHLSLQADSRRALAALLRELQEGIVVVRPAPGQTLPYAVVRDKVERIVFFWLAPSSTKGEFELRCDRVGPAKFERQTLLAGVTRFTFTAQSDGALMLHAILGSGERRFAFHTQVRLRNRAAAEEI